MAAHKRTGTICKGIGKAAGSGCAAPFAMYPRNRLHLCPKCTHDRKIAQMRGYRAAEVVAAGLPEIVRRNTRPKRSLALPEPEVILPSAPEPEQDFIHGVSPNRMDEIENLGVAASFGDRFQEKYRLAVVARIGERE